MGWNRGWVVLLLVLNGCALTGGETAKSPEIRTVQQQKEQGLEVPFALRVLDEVNDGKQLHVKAGLQSKVRWAVSGLVVRLIASRNGERLGVAHYPLTSLHQTGIFAPGKNALIEPGKEFTFALSVPAQDASDYQLELLWGKDAAPYLKTSGGAPVLTNVQVSGVRLVREPGNCPDGNCPASQRVELELINAGTVPVKNIVLGVGFVWLEEGKATPRSSLVPESEDRIPVRNVLIRPGGSRQVRFLIDREIPITPGGRYQPIVRVLDVSS